MDPEKLKKRHSIKVIISEAIMVLTVIITVSVLALIVSGYWLNSDLKVERQGLAQIYSFPTGADVIIDGNSSWLQKTNTSKVLSSGEHSISLSKEGYDTWNKTINIHEGLLYRLHYPRLFLLDRYTEKMMSPKALTGVYVSPDRKAMLITNDTTEWEYLNLDSETVNPQKISISELFSAVSLAQGAEKGLFNGRIIKTIWDKNGSEVLFEAEKEGGNEWVLIDLKNNENSVNITREFGGDFSDIKTIDGSVRNLLGVKDGNLHRIDLSKKSLSSILINNIEDYYSFNNEIIFTAHRNSLEGTPEGEEYYVGLYRIGDEKNKIIENYHSSPNVALTQFYDDEYIVILVDNQLKLYQKDNPDKVLSYELSFAPEEIKVGENGEYIVMSSGTKLATLDMEANSIREWEIENDSFNWLDGSMIYVVSEGKLIVYDFDGFNRREIDDNVSAQFPITITNNKWLYYFRDNNLERQWLIPR